MGSGYKIGTRSHMNIYLDIVYCVSTINNIRLVGLSYTTATLHISLRLIVMWIERIFILSYV